MEGGTPLFHHEGLYSLNLRVQIKGSRVQPSDRMQGGGSSQSVVSFCIAWFGLEGPVVWSFLLWSPYLSMDTFGIVWFILGVATMELQSSYRFAGSEVSLMASVQRFGVFYFEALLYLYTLFNCAAPPGVGGSRYLKWIPCSMEHAALCGWLEAPLVLPHAFGGDGSIDLANRTMPRAAS
eukprot:Gb_14554 [translate_table: standard]